VFEKAEMQKKLPRELVTKSEEKIIERGLGFFEGQNRCVVFGLAASGAPGVFSRI